MLLLLLTFFFFQHELSRSLRFHALTSCTLRGSLTQLERKSWRKAHITTVGCSQFQLKHGDAVCDNNNNNNNNKNNSKNKHSRHHHHNNNKNRKKKNNNNFISGIIYPPNYSKMKECVHFDKHHMQHHATCGSGTKPYLRNIPAPFPILLSLNKSQLVTCRVGCWYQYCNT